MAKRKSKRTASRSRHSGFETLEKREVFAINRFQYIASSMPPTTTVALQSAPAITTKAMPASLPALAPIPPEITQADVVQFLARASAATQTNTAIIAIVDRGGHILGVRTEQGVINDIPNLDTRAFAIDGAVSLARTAAFFANGDPTNGPSGTIGPITSRTVRFISQSTITQREVESNPNDQNPNSTTRGPGFVAPIGLGGHFPPGIRDAPQVDLFAIEHTNRDSIVHPGLDGIKGTPDDIPLASRFNVDPAYIPAGQEIDAPESFGFVSGWFDATHSLDFQSRGMATLPGGIPLYKKDANGNPWLVGGIGVFFPGLNGYATHEQAFNPNNAKQTEADRTNAPLVLQAEYIAFAAAGGVTTPIAGIPTVPNYFFPTQGRIDLAGITLELFGPGNAFTQGIKALKKVGAQVGPAPNGNSGTNWLSGTDGEAVPDGWLVLPHDSPLGTITTADITRIVNAGIATANQTRAQIRLQTTAGGNTKPGAATRMVFSVTDEDGNVLGLYRMQDATYFSIDVAVAKARNMAYYANPARLQPIDRVDDNHDGIPDPSVPAGTAFTSRTVRFLAEGRFPSGIDGSQPGAFSIMFDPGFRTQLLSSKNPNVNSNAVLNAGAPVPASAFNSVLGFDSFHPGRNFHDPYNIANQNGVVFFPGSTAAYKNSVLVGGIGVSGDGVDQDDVVTFFASAGYQPPPSNLTADETFVRKVRLPYIKYSRNPFTL